MIGIPNVASRAKLRGSGSSDNDSSSLSISCIDLKIVYYLGTGYPNVTLNLSHGGDSGLNSQVFLGELGFDCSHFDSSGSLSEFLGSS